MLILSPDHITQTTVNILGQQLPTKYKGKIQPKVAYACLKQPNSNFSVLFEFATIYTHICTYHAEKSSMSFKFNLLSLPYLKLGNSREYRHALSIFSAPTRAMRVVLQLQMTVTIILCALFLEKARLK